MAMAFQPLALQRYKYNALSSFDGDETDDDDVVVYPVYYTSDMWCPLPRGLRLAAALKPVPLLSSRFRLQ